MTDKLQRPESFEFALDFLDDPEASELRAYIEQLEARAALAEPVGEGVEEVTDEALQRTRDEEREACCRWVIENLDLYDPKWVANQLRAHRLGAIAADRVRQTHHTILVPAPMPAPPAEGEVE